MRELVKELFFLFSMETGILGMVKENQEFLAINLLTLGTIALFFGFRIYRVVSSVLVFMAVTIVSIVVMKDITDWGSIVTTFAVLSPVIAFFSYRWYKLDGLIICSLIGMGIGWIYTGSIIVSIVIGVLLAFSMFYFPVITLSFMTSLWGVLIVKDFQLNISLIDDGGTIVSFALVITGFAVQMLMNKNQKIFDKPYPHRVGNWLEKRGITYEDSI